MNLGEETDHKLGNGEIVKTEVTFTRKSSKKVSKGWEDSLPKKYVDFSDNSPILGSFDKANPCSISRKVESRQLRIKRPASSTRQADIVVDDFKANDFDSDDELSAPISNLSTWAFSRGTTFTTQILQDLNSIIFPSKGKSLFGEEWLGKGFVFRDDEELRYGLVQIKGGPCGLLAGVQSFVVKHLLSERNKSKILYF